MKNTPSNSDLESIRHLVNNQPIEDFEGLSSNEMHQLLHRTLYTDSPLKMVSTVTDEIMDQVPFFLLMEEFLKIIEREKSIKLTPLGLFAA